MGTRHSTTAGQHSFARIPSVEGQRSAFDRSCGYKTTFNAGLLIPFFTDEALPGDTMNLQVSTYGRLATPLHPVMDNMWMDTHFFAVPIRLIWDNWVKMNGEQTDPGDSTEFLVPTMAGPPLGYGEETLQDYMGIPTEVKDIIHSALWTRAYNLIWNEWFRDENLQDSVVVDRDDGPDGRADYALLKRGKRHDYFTSCLPFAQKGDSVELPLGTSAPMTMDVGETGLVVDTGDGEPTWSLGASSGILLQTVGTALSIESDTTPVGPTKQLTWDNPKLEAQLAGATGTVDLSTATSATINQIREAFQIQRLFERDARGGSRYTEIIRSHFGVVSPDARLQRPEYLGGGTTAVEVTAIPQTSSTDPAVSPQGNLAAFGVVTSTQHGFNKSFTEHCVIIGLCSVRADLNYQQGLNKQWSRRTRFDFYWPVFANLGEQAVLNQEIYAQGSDNPTEDAAVFGYQERYAEYRYKPSLITGQMRSNAATPLDTWHLAQDFSALPLLDSDFIEEDPPIARIIAVPSEPHFLLDAYFKYRCVRPMPTYSVPGLIDHF